MSREFVAIGSSSSDVQKYPVAKDKGGNPIWATAVVPSQQGDPGILRRVAWDVSGPIGNSVEGREGYLGVDYTDGIDTRFDNIACLAPKINTVTLSTYDTTSYTTSVVKVPTGPGAHTGWTPAAGTNWAAVDDGVGAADDDVTYVSTSTGDATDTFAHAPTGLAPSSSISKVTIRIRARKTATGTPTVIAACLYTDGGLAPTNAATLTDDTAYHDIDVDFTTNPATGDPWKVSELDGVFFGYRFVSGSTVRVTQCYMTVVCASAPTTKGMAISQDSTGVKWLYPMRGRDVAKVRVLDLALVNPVSLITLAEEPTSILATVSPGGTYEVSLAMNGAAYRVITPATFGTADTESANNESKQYRILGQGGVERIFGLKGQLVENNILTSGGVTMDASSWANVTTIVGREVVPTGFAMDGNTAIIGTDRGPLYIDEPTRRLVPLIDEIGPNLDNCRGMTTWSLLGVVIPLQKGLRYFRNGYSASFGIERWTNNGSPVQGFVTGIAPSEKDIWVSLYNPVTGDTYLMVGLPRRDTDRHENPVSWFTIATFTGMRSDCLLDLDGYGGRSRPTLVGGYGSNLFWLDKGRTPRWFDDDLARFASGPGTWYGTELRRDPELIKDLEAVEYDVENTYDGSILASIGVSFDVDGTTVSPAVVGGDGHRRERFTSAGVPVAAASGRRIKPSVTFAVTGAATVTPKLIGPLVLYYHERPIQTRVVRFSVVLRETDQTTVEASEEALLALKGTRGYITADVDDDSGYYRFESVEVETVATTGGSPESSRGHIRIARISAKKFPTESGE